MAKKKKSHGGAKLLVLGAATLGAYYLYGSKTAAKNRKKARSWMLKAKAEALQHAEKVKNLDESDYQKIIDKVEAKYKKFKHVNNAELAGLAKDLKAHWKEIESEFKPKKKAAKRKPAKKKTTKKKVVKKSKK